MALCRYQMVLQPVLTEIKKLKSVRKQSNSGTFTLQKILEKTRKYLVLPPPPPISCPGAIGGTQVAVYLLATSHCF